MTLEQAVICIVAVLLLLGTAIVGAIYGISRSLEKIQRIEQRSRIARDYPVEDDKDYYIQG